MKRLKTTYLIIIITLSLISLSMYATYAMFTANVETGDFVELSASVLPTETKLQEYKRLTINAGESQSILLTIVNSNDSNLYYGVWYEIVDGTKTDDITIAKLSSSINEISGSINTNETRYVKVVIKNTSSSSITVNVGVAYSLTSSLNLPTNRILITDTIQGKYIINATITNGSVNSSTTIVDKGNTATFTITPNTGYKYKSVSCTNATASYSNGTITLTNIKDDVSCTVVNEIITYTVNVSAPNASVNPTSRIINYNGSSTFTVTPNTGYEYSSVSCSSGITGSYNTSNNTLTVSNVTAGGTCTVNFVKKIYTVTATAVNGTASPTSKTVEHGNSTTFTVTPNSGYQYSSVSCPSGITGSYNTTNNTLTVSNVTAGGTCTVNFTIKTYTVTVSAVNGTRSPSSRTVNHGSSTTFTVKPNSGYEYESLSCTGGSYNANTNTLTVSNVTSNRTCTVTFKVANASSSIVNMYDNASKSTFSNNGTTYTSAPSVNLMQDIDGNTRYYGADPNNYVSFNNELWRIIGVFDDIDDGTGKKETRIKIARSESIGNMAWNSTIKNEWPGASLNTYLNGTYLSSMTSTAQSMVDNALWNLGGIPTFRNLYAKDYYTYERGTTVYSGRSTEWTGKVALMYPSDYVYSADLSKCTLDGFSWSNDTANCRDTSWLKNTEVRQWTLTPSSNFNTQVYFIQTSGFVYENMGFNVSYTYAVRPVLYLKSTVAITGGSGTASNPYTLG